MKSFVTRFLGGHCSKEKGFDGECFLAHAEAQHVLLFQSKSNLILMFCLIFLQNLRSIVLIGP